MIGVYFHKASGKWAAQIRIGDKVKHLGLFENEDKAMRAFDKKARKLGKKTLNYVDPND